MPERKKPVPVYFTSLEIKNVRCFGRRQVLKLTADRGRPARWTLILGENGVGKTTLLECLTWMRLVPEIDQEDLSSQERDDLSGEELLLSKGKLVPALSGEGDDVLERLRRVGANRSTIRAKLSFDGTLASVGEESGTGRRGKIINPGARISFDKKGLSGYDELGNPPRIAELEGGFHDPLIVAYGANRKLGVMNLNLGREDLHPIDFRLAGETELYDIEEMLRTLDYASNAKNQTGPEYVRREELKKALARILPRVEFNPAHIEILPPTVNRWEPTGVCLRTDYGLVPFSALSLGYQVTMAWVADLAWRLLERYPASPNPLEEPAVVLIDEIDLHLHPRWQLRIMDDLSAVFRGTQFIATSHSPLMVQVAEKANFVLLREIDAEVEIVNEPEVVSSWRVDQILTSELFGLPGARNEQTELLYANRDELAAIPSPSPEQKAELERLRIQISKIPTAGDPQDQIAMELIRKAATLLKQHNLVEP